VEFLQGYLGQPAGGFMEPFRSRVLKTAVRIEGRPGGSMNPMDFASMRGQLEKRHAGQTIREVDLVSASQYPKEFDEYMTHRKRFGNVARLPTNVFLVPLRLGQETSFEEGGRTHVVKLVAIKPLNKDGNFPVQFELNGSVVIVAIRPTKPIPYIQRQVAGVAAASNEPTAPKANTSDKRQVGAPMPGKVLSMSVQAGSEVVAGQPLLTLNAMKLETVISAPIAGRVKRILVKSDDNVSAGDLLLEFE